MTERILKLVPCLVLILSAGEGTAQETVCDVPERAYDIPDTSADVVFFGELHGNKETPEAFLAAVCQHLERQAGDVRVALELHTDIQSSLDTFMESDGSSEAVEEFLRHPHWRRGMNLPDGRSSVAMLNLVEALRKLRFEQQVGFGNPVRRPLDKSADSVLRHFRGRRHGRQYHPPLAGIR